MAGSVPAGRATTSTRWIGVSSARATQVATGRARSANGDPSTGTTIRRRLGGVATATSPSPGCTTLGFLSFSMVAATAPIIRYPGDASQGRRSRSRRSGMLRTMRIAIVGAGSVGATAAYACLLRGVAEELVIQDVDRAKAEAQALDLAHDNVRMCRHVVPGVASVAPNALWLVVTNPVDVITRATLTVSGLDPARVVGTGTVLDSSRLRVLLADRCRVAVQNVHAYVVSEHGDSEVALWSSATVGGVPLAQWGPVLGGAPSADERQSMLDDVRRAAYRIVAGKWATKFPIGVVAA